jgi:hypothetical protein
MVRRATSTTTETSMNSTRDQTNCAPSLRFFNGSSPEVWSLGLSRDEKKLYYIVQAPYGDGPVNIDDLYEYNIATGVRTKLMNLKGALGGGAKISGGHTTLSNGKIYFGFHASSGGLLELDVSSRSGPAPTGNNE